jgi:hypothetical protein
MMPPFVFSAAFLGTFLSVTFLSFLAYREHNPESPRSFSKLVAEKRRLVNWFRVASAVCPTLCAVTLYALVVPNVRHASALFVSWTIFYVSELLLAIFPERGAIEKQLHSFFAYTMGAALIVSALIFIFALDDSYKFIEVGITMVMLSLATLTQLDRKRFIFYELGFIYSSHVSLLVAAVAVK